MGFEKRGCIFSLVYLGRLQMGGAMFDPEVYAEKKDVVVEEKEEKKEENKEEK
jgi:hypothetical protein